MLPHHLLKKFQNQKTLLVAILQIHMALLLLIGIIVLMGSLKKGGGAPFHFLFPTPTPDTKTTGQQPSEREP